MLAKVTVAEAANAVADAPDRIRLEFIAPFVEAAARVLTQEHLIYPQVVERLVATQN